MAPIPVWAFPLRRKFPAACAISAVEKFQGNNSTTSALNRAVAYWERLVDDKSSGKGTPDFYREKAMEMRRQAATAHTPETRDDLLILAEHWERLAQTLESRTG